MHDGEHECRSPVRIACPEQQVVYMPVIGFKGMQAAGYADREHPESIEQRDNQNGN